jgi:hypothetical protein
MTRFGDQSLTEQFGPVEMIQVIVPNTPVGPNVQTNFTIGTYVMPFNGRLIAEYKSRTTWTADQTWQRATLLPSTPAPSQYSEHAQWSGLQAGYTLVSEIPMTAQWDLTKGTTVTLIGRVSAGALAGITIVALGGLLRAIPT